MKIVSVQEAKARLSRLIEEAEEACMGEDIIIACGKHRAVRLVPIGVFKGKRRLGILKGKLVVGPEFVRAASARRSRVLEIPKAAA